LSALDKLRSTQESVLSDCTPSKSADVTNWEEQLTLQRVMLPSRGTWTGWRNGLTGTS